MYFKLKPFVLAKWSASLPGVPITMWGFLARATAYAIMSRPPTKTTVFKWIPAPRASKWFAIYKHNSLVGEITHAKNGWGLSSKAWMIGIAKAAVFPEPVSASPIMSFPLRV